MKKQLRNIAAATLILMRASTSFSQAKLATVAGVFLEKSDAELWIIAKTNASTQLLVQHFKEKSEDLFSFQLPVNDSVDYLLRVNILKQGSRRLVKDKSVTVPLKLTAGSTVAYEIQPSKLEQEKLNGVKEVAATRKTPMLTIRGHLSKLKYANTLVLNKVQDGQLKPVQSFNISKGDSAFTIYAPIASEGFYYLSTPAWRKRIYLKPNDEVQLVLDARTGSIEKMTYTPENKLLLQWQQLIAPITSYGYERSLISPGSIKADSFYNKYRQLQPKIEQFIEQAGTANQRFNFLLRAAMTMDRQLTAMKVMYALSTKTINGFTVPAKEFRNVPADIAELIMKQPVASPALMQIGEGSEYLDLFTRFSLLRLDESKRNNLSAAESLRLRMEAIPNDALKTAFLAQQLHNLQINNLSEFKLIFAPHEKYASTAEVKEKFTKVYKQFADDTTYIGKSSYNFSLTDSTGKMVSMQDFRGKVILVDVWATWCGPCKGQFPYLREIEEEYKGNSNIVFVSISIDKAEARQKWLDMINKEHLGGIQLLDDKGLHFARKYGIYSIPRFLLIDKQGRWIEIRCPLPEDKKSLKAYLDKALQEG